MKKSLIFITIALAIFFYQTTSNSSGSVVGKTGSPSNVTDCTATMQL
tara:strand:+ start:138 stop:278 length:141 start_codon:yes stop_codon:yes gene_type:complete